LRRDEQQVLLLLARTTIDRYLTGETAPLVRGLGPRLEIRQGAFVTLHDHHGRLRGCIGHMAEDTPLGQVVGKMALQAAFADRRFDPVAPGELERLHLEISVLTPRRAVTGPQDIAVGRDGVVIARDGRSAVFLPQVAVEQGWDLATTLTQLCRKAGLPPDAWRLEGTSFWTFQAEVFAEDR
jgi:AmmeMemoRadiSam system protein A